jgi:uncharacterized membrane protein
MTNNIIKWLKEQFKQTVTSIAFFPAITAIVFLLISGLMLELDYSEAGKNLKAQWQWLSLKDASTARNIISTVAAGVISLTVFSFSMVMIVLNQAASLLSNRILDKLIGNRFQQIVLGFYIGTIVYALFLLSTIRDIDSGVYVPALSTYLLIVITVLDIFLFIYFLHYITQSVKYETIINRIYRQTKQVMEKSCLHPAPAKPAGMLAEGVKIKSPASGIFQGFDQASLLKICEQENLTVAFIYATETYILKDTPLLVVLGKNKITPDLEKQLRATFDLHRGEDIATNYFYGFRQLTEVAIKALSPGINDPGTAVLSLHALADLLAYRSQHFPDEDIKDDSGQARIILKEKTFEEIFSLSLLPIWDYGKNDRMVQQALSQLLVQMQMHSRSPVIEQLLECVRETVLLTRS